ncbi:MAG: hypothetical protein EOP48_34600 [Sphingobacteriales bacterium]|nr:MAG: hypothetical protein EOP48_34600 [Sphingobacteriales bacterium]
MERKGATLYEDARAQSILKYRKSEYVEYWLHYGDGKITALTIKASPDTHENAVDEIKNKSIYKKTKVQIIPNTFGLRENATYTKDNFTFVSNWEYFLVTATMKGPSANNSGTQPPTSSGYDKSQAILFNSAKEVADLLNQNMYRAGLVWSAPEFDFEVLGAIEVGKRSVKFIAKENSLYVQVHIPQNSGCAQITSEFKAKSDGGVGGAPDSFNVSFSFPYCGIEKYQTIHVFVCKPIPTYGYGVSNYLLKYAK